MSEVLNVGNDAFDDDDDDDVNDCGSSVARQGTGSDRTRSTAPRYSIPDPTRLTGAPTFQRSRWETSVEAQRLADVEEASNLSLNAERMGSQSVLRHGGEDGNEDRGIIVENIPILSDSQPEIFPADSSPLCDGVSGVSISSSPWKPSLQAANSGPPAGRRSGTPIASMSPLVQQNAVEGPTKKTRRYCPPSFSCTGAPESAGGASGGYKALLPARVNRGASSSLSGHQADGFAPSPAAVAVHSPHDDDDDDDDGTPLVSLHNFSPPPPATVPVFKTPSTQQSRLPLLTVEEYPFPIPSSSSQDGEDGECEAKEYPEINVTTPNYGSGDIIRSSFEEGGKELLPQTSPQELGADNSPKEQEQEQQGGTNLIKETNETPLSVSPSPSYKEYEWATKAQEALEQQQKRCHARTPSTNPPSPPPPLQVGGFGLPQLPRGRRAAHLATLDEEEGKLSSEIPHSVKKKSHSPRALPESAAQTTKISTTQPSKKSTASTGPATRRAAPKEDQTPVVSEGASTTMRSRRAAVSPPPTAEFPLPQAMTTSGSGAKQSAKKKKRSRK
ncbi:hypothetical protein DQ04_01971020 [Trypanosoma grayi]|uniref:hypothetical protein n=1 Tax=Trypanosoma grayi TaxID=71804 RepID=UPI0004F46E09|nr:hypothetical protein DQ04_01971020 [Trypanosoma grayi]KEG12130.1 hypothetical protein DQ04_01971020 [Trypanosoma grayi]